MNTHEDIGLILPKVLNPDGDKQPMYKLLPSSMDSIVRSFIPPFFKVFSDTNYILQNDFHRHKIYF